MSAPGLTVLASAAVALPGWWLAWREWDRRVDAETDAKNWKYAFDRTNAELADYQISEQRERNERRGAMPCHFCNGAGYLPRRVTKG